MFPYARDNVRKHLTSTFDSEETKDDIKLLRIQVSKWSDDKFLSDTNSLHWLFRLFMF